MAQALYRKYRSKSLDEVVGQDHITKTLALALKQGKVSHAYLFTGPKGTGKTSIARILAHEVNKLPYSDDASHLDIIEIDAASNRRIDDIRDLREKVHIAPTSAAYKVYIIDEVHMLTGESFNALLKTLEEPPAHAIFILATTEVHKLPATIISRAQRYHFRPIQRDSAIKHLKFIAKNEGLKIDDAALEMIADRGDGSFRDSISLLDQLGSMSGGKIDAEFVERVMGIAPKAAIESLLEAIKAGDSESVYAQVQQLDTQGVAAAVISDQLISSIMQDAHNSTQLAFLVDELLDVPKSLQPKVKLLVTLLKNQASSAMPPAVKPKKPAPAAATPAIEIKKAAPDEIRQKLEKPVEQQDKKVDLAPVETIGSGEAFTAAAWPQVLASIHTSNPPVYSVLKRAHITCEAGTLKLTFGFKLHQKKMDDQKYRAKLISAITAQGFACPKIDVVFGQVTDAAFITEAVDQPVDETSASVLAMMGEGEAVHGTS